jgi:hypothetical protein
MADFNGTILTTAGLNLLAQAQAGETLQFTQVVLGSGTWSSSMNPASMTSLVYPSQTVPIQSVSVVGDGTARLRFLISNSSLSLGYLLSEIGIYAQTTSSPNTLYAVTYANNPDFIPAAGVTTIEDVIDIYTVVSNAQSVTAVINNSVMLATMQDLYTARPEFSNTAPIDTYAGKIWVSDTQPAEFYDGTTWQPFNAGLLNGYAVGSATGQIPLNNGTLNITLNADMVDGFHASTTPTPNMLLPLNANAQFPISVLPPGIGNGYANPINLTSATADYMLQPGEVAYISFTNQTPVPFHIAIPEPSSPTTPVIYEITVAVATGSYSNGVFAVYPNNTTYSNAFSMYGVEITSSDSVSVWNPTASYFIWDIQLGSSDTPPITIKATVSYFGYAYKKQIMGLGGDEGGIAINSAIWNDTSTKWSSLGSFDCLNNTGTMGAITGVAIIRRIS